MKKKMMHITLPVVISGFVLIVLISVLGRQMHENILYNEVQQFYVYRALQVLMLIIFGVLIEYRKVVSVFRNGMHLNIYYFIGAAVLIALLIIPVNVGMEYSSSLSGVLSSIINNMSTRSVLGILAGILFVRSFQSEIVKQEASLKITSK